MSKSLKWQDFAGKRDYGRAVWKRSELLFELVKCAALVLWFAWFFYRSLWAVPLMSLVGFLYFKQDSRKKADRDKRILLLQFRDCIQAADTAMRAGYSVENAFIESIQDMNLLHGEQSDISQELQLLRRGLVVNRTLEELLADFGRRSGIGKIAEFSEVFTIAKRSGGNMAEVMRIFAESIHERIEAEETIRTNMAARRLEQMVMNLMPFGIMLYVQVTNRGYFDGLYHNFPGICIMSGCLLAYLAAYLLAEKILGETLV